MQRERNIRILEAAMQLPLSDSEHHLLRNITHHYKLGTHVDWAASNSHREADVRALFTRCLEMLGVPQPQV